MDSCLRGLCTFIIIYVNLPPGGGSLWAEWWNYEGISGPAYWGRMNTDWYLCSKGKNQSPIDIDPRLLLFDPNLKHIDIDGDVVSGTLVNNGYDLTLEINDTDAETTPVNLTLGPLSYNYRLKQIKLHFGSENYIGSEHTIQGKAFPGEIHLVAYNSDVYANISRAQTSPKGIAIIAAFLQVNHNYRNPPVLWLLLGQRTKLLKGLHIKQLLPNIDTYITYEGSFTQPGCHETVTWIVINKPLKVHKDQMETLRNLRQGDMDHPQAFMADNFRPIMPLHTRTIRTNINFLKGCTMAKDMHYEVNTNFKFEN
ncbi:hypothetical protein CHS0354_012720 [Potamilus streckersoni]|uniref:Carbonic anhydrase n=1 Tax=Potamilus streckersoni TaxID=2493646 RepID=A0AAE0SYN2_9BIVA|nr:hypothetical protein CHS0354_012720 [Potamilus streckersoni]